MHAPKTVNIIYEGMVRSAATTVIIPKAQNALLRYEQDPHAFYSKEDGFKIYVPEGWIVQHADRTKVSVSPASTSNLFLPKIELLAENTSDINFMGIFQQRLDCFRANHQQLIKYHVDEQFQVVTFELMNNKTDNPRTFQIQKYFLRPGKVYILKVDELVPGETEGETQMIQEIKQIVQSFAFIR